MNWNVRSTKPFERALRKRRKNRELLDALDQKIKRLREDPVSVGGHLSGKLHGLKATRLIGKFRLIFRIVEPTHTVWLSAIDHRKYDYEGFTSV